MENTTTNRKTVMVGCNFSKFEVGERDFIPKMKGTEGLG